jgi:hypothetical protein
MADPFIAPPVDFGPAASFVAPPVAFGTHEAHAGKSGCGAGPGGFQPGNMCGKGGHGGSRAERHKARREHHAAIVAKHPFLEGKAIGSLMTSDLTTEQVHAIDRTAHVVHERSTVTARGPLVSVVKTNPFHGILADERRFYEVHTLAGDLQDSRAHNDQGKAIVAADRWHNRIVKEIARDARRGGAKFGLTVAGPAVEFAAKAAHREKLTGGRWITIETADGGYRRLYIKGGKGGHGGKVIAGGGATPGHPKTLGEVATGHREAGPAKAAKEPPTHPGDIRQRLQDAPHHAARAQIAGEFLHKTQSEKPTSVKAHGMSEAEDLHSLEFEGVTYHFPKLKSESDFFHPMVSTMAELGGRPPLPAALTKHTSAVIFSEQANRHDAHFERAYEMPGLVSKATGGDGRIVRYHGERLTVGDMAHEMGHNLAKGVYGSLTPPMKSPFGQAALSKSKEPPPTEYAKVKFSEDFAESVDLYVTRPDHLKSIAPKRHAAIRELLGPGS